jgi:anti-sigma B factor antagonist
LIAPSITEDGVPIGTVTRSFAEIAPPCNPDHIRCKTISKHFNIEPQRTLGTSTPYLKGKAAKAGRPARPRKFESNLKGATSMKISQRQVGDVTILEPKGKITIGAGDIQLREAIEAATGSGKSKLLLDFHGVSKMDSSGLGELLAAHKTVTSGGGSIRLMNLPSKLYGVLGITQIVSVFDVFDDENEAVSSFH